MWTQRFDVPAFVENEANAAALGEYYFGIAHNVQNLIYSSAGIGLGGGIIIKGRLFRGSSGYAGEVGHMTVDSNGELCGCGKQGVKPDGIATCPGLGEGTEPSLTVGSNEMTKTETLDQVEARIRRTRQGLQIHPRSSVH